MHDCGTDWAVSELLKSKLQILRSLHYSRPPRQDKAAKGCSFSTPSSSASAVVSSDKVDETMIKDQSSTSRHCLETTSTSAVVNAASASVSNAEDVNVTSSVIR